VSRAPHFMIKTHAVIVEQHKLCMQKQPPLATVVILRNCARRCVFSALLGQNTFLHRKKTSKNRLHDMSRDYTNLLIYSSAVCNLLRLF
jgi:hypothetical protein